MNTTIRKLVGCVSLILSLALASQAGQYWWSGNGTTLGGNGTWNTTSNNWSATGAAPFGAWPNGADEAIFTNAAGTVTLSGPINVNKLTFDVNSCIIAGGTLNLTGSNPTFTKRSTGDNTWEAIDSPLSGSSDLTLVGIGNWQGIIHLRANNSNFTGRIVVTNGLDLAFTNDVNLGLAPASFTSDALIFRGANLRSGTGSYRPSLNANRGINNIGGITVYEGINLSSPITGPGGITFRSDGLGSMMSSSANDYTGATQLYTDSGSSTYLVLGVDNALPHGAGKGNLTLTVWSTGMARVDLNGHNAVINGLVTGGSSTYYYIKSVIDNVSAGGTVTLTLGDGNATGNNYYGQIKNTTGTINLTKIGTGSQTLSGSCTYTGATTVNGGTLTIAGTNSASSGMAVNNGATLVISGFLSNAVPLTVNAGTLQADLSVNTNGVFNSASAVTLAGGTLNIKGKNSGTSATALGNLVVNAGGSTVSLTPNGGSGTTLSLSNTWTRQVGGTLTMDISAAGSTVTSSPTLTNGIIGGYAFVKDGTGTGFGTVSGGNVVRYTGATVLDAAAASGNLDGTVNYVVTNSVTLSGSNATQPVNSLRLESQ
ncbi:MAG: autotransporter-associated beta strand repeat-containing protein, partial [bacterium]